MTDSFRSRAEMDEIPRGLWDIRVPDRGFDAAVLQDGDMRTAWSTGDRQAQDVFIRVRLFFPLPAEFPIHFRVEGILDDAPSAALVFDGDWAFTSLARSLWKSPLAAFMDIDLEPVVVSGFRIRVLEDDPFQLPITISEIRAYRAPSPPRSTGTVPDPDLRGKSVR